MLGDGRPYVESMSNTALTTKSITLSDISALRREAALAQDIVQMAMCDRAMGQDVDADDWTTDNRAEYSRLQVIGGMTEHDAIAACVRAINNARAQVDAA
jgi:hypothetical protein